jgi:hypothetical protein
VQRSSAGTPQLPSLKQTALRHTAASLHVSPFGFPHRSSAKQTPDWQMSPVQALLLVRPQSWFVVSQVPLRHPRGAFVELHTPPTGLGDGSDWPFGAFGVHTPLSVAQNWMLLHSASSKQPAPHAPETGSQ